MRIIASPHLGDSTRTHKSGVGRIAGLSIAGKRSLMHGDEPQTSGWLICAVSLVVHVSPAELPSLPTNGLARVSTGSANHLSAQRESGRVRRALEAPIKRGEEVGCSRKIMTDLAVLALYDVAILIYMFQCLGHFFLLS